MRFTHIISVVLFTRDLCINCHPSHKRQGLLWSRPPKYTMWSITTQYVDITSSHVKISCAYPQLVKPLPLIYAKKTCRADKYGSKVHASFDTPHDPVKTT